MSVDVTQQLLAAEHYNAVVSTKKQIVLHHTAGSSDPTAVIQGWAATTTKVGAHLVLGGISRKGDAKYDGKVYQAVDYRYWLWHLGIKAGQTTIQHGVLDSQSVGIEICNYGWLTKNAAGAYVTYLGNIVPADQVVDLGTPWRGYQYWHRYTDAQLATVKELVPELADQFGITLEKGRTFDLDDFNVDIDGSAKKAVAFHASFRQDKWDTYPSPALIDVLNQIHA